MKGKEAFNIPAYKYGLIKLKEHYNEMLSLNANNAESIQRILKRVVGDGEISIIPFADVDGLTIDEIQKTLNVRGPLVMACYSECNIYSTGADTRTMYLLHTFTIAGEVIEEYKDNPYDQVIEKILEDLYPNAEKNVKRMIRCFFERYQDKTHQNTVERIQKINIRK